MARINYDHFHSSHSLWRSILPCPRLLPTKFEVGCQRPKIYRGWWGNMSNPFRCSYTLLKSIEELDMIPINFETLCKMQHYNLKTIFGFGFVISGVIKVNVEISVIRLSLWLCLIQLTSTSIIPDITKTKFNK